jgi:hypothetical protein
MKKSLAILFLTGIFFSCEKMEENDRFLISKDRVGFLTKDLQVRQLDSVFQEDSIVAKNSRELFGGQNQITVYGKDGKAMLLLDPVQSFDSTSTIGNIRIIDGRYQTELGLGVNSSFKDIMSNYDISRIENTLDAAVVFIDKINAYVTFDKENLPGKFQNNTNMNIEVSDIPETAPIEYFWIGWE